MNRLWGKALAGAFLSIFFALSACTKNINPFDYKTEISDRQKSDSYPSDTELAFRKKSLLLVFNTFETLLKEGVADVMFDFYDKGFSRFPQFAYKNFRTLPENLQDFDFGNPSYPYELGKASSNDYVLELIVKNTRYSGEKRKETFEAEILFRIHRVSLRQVMAEERVLFVSDKRNLNQTVLRKFVEQYFPVRAYLLETKGNKTVGLINAGRSLGVIKGNKITVRKREKTKTDLKVDGEALNFVKKITYSEEIIAEGEVILVLEDASWVYFTKKKEKELKSGDAVFFANIGLTE